MFRPVSLDDVSIVLDGVDHTEGVAVTEEGMIWCGGEEGQIYYNSLSGPPTVITTLPTRPWGVAADGDGNAYFCCGRQRSWDFADNVTVGVYRITPGGDVAFIGGGPSGAPCRHANHLAFLPDGSLLFSDSGIWGSDNGCLIRIDAQSGISIADRSVSRSPNGLAVSPDGSFVAVVESTLPGVSALYLDSTGKLGERRVLAELPGTIPDGVAFDERGRMLISCWCPDSVYLIDGSRVDLLLHDPTRFSLHSPCNLAFLPGTSNVLCANYGERFLALFEHDAPGATVLRPKFEYVAGTVLIE